MTSLKDFANVLRDQKYQDVSFHNLIAFGQMFQSLEGCSYPSK